ncbi:dephospho-CoA kinase [Thauera linaloolentis]|uniref:Dephospho-CoA kinase n=1 Tax=Thauera linaloolentis (strain DSM 12138 / JCM 21573 / CCUG 41526 / CIP 105981 / IAM 15112 / NBRC 102519 / 47Lol) TaxID=1123367 RepID=N6Y4R4_THAL4|nr:dephospho-CoA kinase [Thauera linaloolentis]ENO86585.1 dephospho-CoA kinase [Thauera linaloolentis 47Lol = DSM 12138]MCM8565771.1 dephospho-CoA kinase [Thauera linaloolentis]
MATAPPSPSRPFIVGLTGGIGSGKSAAAELFVEHGAGLVDTDAIAHALTAADGAAMPAIHARFGDAVIAADGSLDRAAMRARVFAQADARQQLEAILHPMIRDESARQCTTARGIYVILAVPLLVESGGYRTRCDRVCVVDCPPEIQVERVRARSGLEEAQIRAIMATQASRDQRLAAADDVIDNGASLEYLRAQVAALHSHYASLAARRA